MKKTEIILAMLAVIAIILNFLLVPGGVVLTIFTLFLLSCLYFVFSFALLSNIRFRDIFKRGSFKEISTLKAIGTIVTGFSLSLAINGIVFKLLFWPGAAINLMGGIIFLVIISIVCGIKYTAKLNRPYYSRILMRTGIISVCCLLLMPFSSQEIHNFKYRNYPDFLKAEKQFNENPDDQELLNKYEEERRKMDEQN